MPHSPSSPFHLGVSRIRGFFFLSVLFVLTLSFSSCAKPQEEEPVTEMPGRFFGFHFDFHASPLKTLDGSLSPDEPVIGATLTEQDIRSICQVFSPDFLQTDCKGHPGWTSYPSKLGNAMPLFQGDPLALWRKVTKEEGVELYMHYSGVVDQKWAAEHPQEAVKDISGRPDSQITRTNGTYADELMIPQLLELAEYGVDGMWIDGDCWGAAVDFDPRTVQQFEREKGVSLGGVLPSQPGIPYYDEYRDFCRDLYRRYLSHVVDSVHSVRPDFKICSNWAFSDHMPEQVCADVSHLSGDLPHENAYIWARLSARSLAKQGKAWDLMSWGFRNAPAYVPKHPAQILQEAAAVISLGGGFQVYIPQKRDGSPKMDEIMAFEPLAKFMHERRKWCYGGQALPQACILFSTYDRYHSSSGLFSRDHSENLYGLLNLVCEAGHSVTMASEHDLVDGKINDYPVLIIPELTTGLAPETFAMIKEYVLGGGSLMLTGANTCALFAKMGFPCAQEEGQVIQDKTAFWLLGASGGKDGVSGMIYDYRPLASPAGTLLAATNKPFASVETMGKGKVVAISSNIGSVNDAYGQYMLTDLVRRGLSQLYDAKVKVASADGKIDIVDLVKDQRLMIQLANAGGQHHAKNYLTEETIAPVRDITLQISLDEKPESIFLQPENRRLSFQWKDGVATVTVPEVAFHEVVVVKP